MGWGSVSPWETAASCFGLLVNAGLISCRERAGPACFFAEEDPSILPALADRGSTAAPRLANRTEPRSTILPLPAPGAQAAARRSSTSLPSPRFCAFRGDHIAASVKAHRRQPALSFVRQRGLRHGRSLPVAAPDSVKQAPPGIMKPEPSRRQRWCCPSGKDHRHPEGPPGFLKSPGRLPRISRQWGAPNCGGLTRLASPVRA